MQHDIEALSKRVYEKTCPKHLNPLYQTPWEDAMDIVKDDMRGLVMVVLEESEHFIVTSPK